MANVGESGESEQNRLANVDKFIESELNRLVNVDESGESEQIRLANVDEFSESDPFSKKGHFAEYSNSINLLSSGHCLVDTYFSKHQKRIQKNRFSLFSKVRVCWWHLLYNGRD